MKSSEILSGLELSAVVVAIGAAWWMFSKARDLGQSALSSASSLYDTVSSYGNAAAEVTAQAQYSTDTLLDKATERGLQSAPALATLTTPAGMVFGFDSILTKIKTWADNNIKPIF